MDELSEMLSRALNGSESKARFTQSLGFSNPISAHTFLNQIIRGERNIPKVRVRDFAKVLKISTAEMEKLRLQRKNQKRARRLPDINFDASELQFLSGVAKKPEFLFLST